MPEPTQQVQSNVSQAAIQAVVNKQSPPVQIYDPQLRSPIAKPVDEICPTCGQIKPRQNKAFLTHMNNYINEQGVVVTISSNDNTINMKGVPYYKVTSQELVPDTETGGMKQVWNSAYMPGAKTEVPTSPTPIALGDAPTGILNTPKTQPAIDIVPTAPVTRVQTDGTNVVPQAKTFVAPQPAPMGKV
jgi:hypothetical protein